jgi:hypothetical protein
MTFGVSRTSVKDPEAVLEALSTANANPVAEDPDMKQAIAPHVTPQSTAEYTWDQAT